MKKIFLDMDLLAGLIMVDTKLWDLKKNDYSHLSITLDTGASMTTLSKDILFRAGYDVTDGKTRRITTASGIEYVQEVELKKIKLGNYELSNITVYAHTFPQESFSSGVLGLNVLSAFDVNLLFSEKRIELTVIDE